MPTTKPSTKSIIRRFIIVTLFLLLVFGGIFAWKMFEFSMMEQAMSGPEPATEVEAVRVETSRWTPSLQAIGSVRAVNGIEVANEMQGVVEHLRFESGDLVKKGDVLLELDTASDRATLATREAEAALAQQEFDRLSNLLAKEAVSQSRFDEAQANFDAARARVSEQQAQLNKKIIRAPFDGKLGLRLVDLGQYLAVGTPIVGINTVDPILVQYTLPEKYLSRIADGDTVSVTVAAQPDQQFEGTIKAINSTVSADSRTVQVRARLSNPDNLLRPGMFANVRTLANQDDELLVLPRTAISYNTYGDYVYLIVEDEDGHKVTERRTVVSGQVRNGMVAIEDGLKEGDQVVSTGLLRLRAGEKVSIVDEAQQAEREEERAEEGLDRDDAREAADEALGEGAN